jgi:hypothetical protein
MGAQRSRVKHGDKAPAPPGPPASNRDQWQPEPIPHAIPKVGHHRLHLAKADEAVYDIQNCMNMPEIK